MSTVKNRLLLVVFMLLVVSSQSFGQGYRPMLQVGKTWHMNYPNMSWPDGSHDGKWEMTVEKDTIVGGEQCFKVLSWMSFRPDGGGYYLMQEQDRKVWWLTDTYSSGRKLLFDFTLMVGDSVTVSEGSDMTVEHVDSIEVSGEVYKRITMYRAGSGYNEEERQVWVEGIGSKSSPLLSLTAQGAVGLDIRLDSCTLGGRCVFRREDFLAPTYHANNDATSIPRINAISVTNSPKYYDLQGRRLTGRPGRGLYIRDGKKVVLSE